MHAVFTGVEPLLSSLSKLVLCVHLLTCRINVGCFLLNGGELPLANIRFLSTIRGGTFVPSAFLCGCVGIIRRLFFCYRSSTVNYSSSADQDDQGCCYVENL